MKAMKNSGFARIARMTTDKKYCACERIDGYAEYRFEDETKICVDCGQEWDVSNNTDKEDYQ